MVDPINFTNYHRSDIELEEMLLFSVLVAGKNALTTARLLEEMLSREHFYQCRTERAPFACLRDCTVLQMVNLLRKSGFGCYQMKGRALYELVHSKLNLRTCTVEDLESITGIGPKTARMFVLHSRPDAECAALDVHILHHLQDLGYAVTRTTPGSKKLYAKIERICVELAKRAGKTVADWDLDIWRQYRQLATEKKRAPRTRTKRKPKTQKVHADRQGRNGRGKSVSVKVHRDNHRGPSNRKRGQQRSQRPARRLAAV